MNDVELDARLRRYAQAFDRELEAAPDLHRKIMIAVTGRPVSGRRAWLVQLSATAALIALGVGMWILLGRVPAERAVQEVTPGATAGQMLTARAYHTATLLLTGKVLVVGGAPGSLSGLALASAEIYDPVTNSWSAAASMSTGREFHTATLLPDGKVLVLGGQVGANNKSIPDQTPLSSGEIFDPSRGTWSLINPMPRARSGHTATLLRNGQVLVAGGSDLAADRYDPVTGRWSSAGAVPMPMSRPGQRATLLADGRVMIAPGFTGDGMPFGPTPIYDPRSGSWSTVAPMTWGRTEAVGSTLLPSGEVLVVGASAAGIGVSTAEIFRPSTNTWAAVYSDTQDTRFNFWTVLTLPSGTALAFAGNNPTVSSLSAGKVYDPSSGAWSSSLRLIRPRISGFSATLLPNGNVLIAGGLPGTSSAAEQYSP